MKLKKNQIQKSIKTLLKAFESGQGQPISEVYGETLKILNVVFPESDPLYLRRELNQQIGWQNILSDEDLAILDDYWRENKKMEKVRDEDIKKYLIRVSGSSEPSFSGYGKLNS